jgi:hypothetical protein
MVIRQNVSIINQHIRKPLGRAKFAWRLRIIMDFDSPRWKCAAALYLHAPENVQNRHGQWCVGHFVDVWLARLWEIWLDLLFTPCRLDVNLESEFWYPTYLVRWIGKQWYLRGSSSICRWSSTGWTDILLYAVTNEISGPSRISSRESSTCSMHGITPSNFDWEKRGPREIHWCYVALVWIPAGLMPASSCTFFSWELGASLSKDREWMGKLFEVEPRMTIR